jgi:hypothetical protein
VASWWATISPGSEHTVNHVEDQVNHTTLDIVNDLPNYFQVRSLLPLGATKAGVTATASLAGGTGIVTSVRTIALPPCTRASGEVWCDVQRPTYAHTFDAATGTATVWVSNGRYCFNTYDVFSLASYLPTPTGTYVRNGMTSALGDLGSSYYSSTIGTLVLITDLPKCVGKVVLRYGNSTDTLKFTDPTTDSSILGAPNSPSAGPIGYGSTSRQCTGSPTTRGRSSIPPAPKPAW